MSSQLSLFLREVRSRRATLGKSVLVPVVIEALESVELPKGWVQSRNESSVQYRREQFSMPCIKVYYAGLRVDIDTGSGYSVKTEAIVCGTVADVVETVRKKLSEFATNSKA